MMKQEERLRSSQNTLTEQLNEALLGVRDELRPLRKMNMGHVARPDTSKPAPRTLSEVSSRPQGEARARCKRRELAPISTAALLETSHSAHVRV